MTSENAESEELMSEGIAVLNYMHEKDPQLSSRWRDSCAQMGRIFDGENLPAEEIASIMADRAQVEADVENFIIKEYRPNCVAGCTKV
jgi:hypothetical protein